MRFLIVPALLGVVLFGVAFNASPTHAKGNVEVLQIDLVQAYDSFGDTFWQDEVSGNTWGSVSSIDALDQTSLTVCFQRGKVLKFQNGTEVVNMHIRCNGHADNRNDHYISINGEIVLLTQRGEGNVLN